MTMRGDIIIGIFKLAKALLLLVVAGGAISLLDSNIRGDATQFITHLSGDSHFRVLRTVASTLGLATKSRIEMISIGSFFYAALFATEGIGLLIQKRWAEYFTSIVTGSFIPLEIYEIARHPNAFKIALLVANAAIVVYLIWRLNR
jgi:uncharacterized membrane protein (DUF2068 family)